MNYKRIKQLKNKFSQFNIDGYIIPKNDEFFSEYAATDRLKIINVIESNNKVVELVEMRTQHLGPEEILIGVRVAFNETLQVKEIADLINHLEEKIRIEIKDAGPIFIEPELSKGN